MFFCQRLFEVDLLEKSFESRSERLLFSLVEMKFKTDHKSEPADFCFAKEGLLQEMHFFSLQWKWRFQTDHKSEPADFYFAKEGLLQEMGFFLFSEKCSFKTEFFQTF